MSLEKLKSFIKSRIDNTDFKKMFYVMFLFCFGAYLFYNAGFSNGRVAQCEEMDAKLVVLMDDRHVCMDAHSIEMQSAPTYEDWQVGYMTGINTSYLDAGGVS